MVGSKAWPEVESRASAPARASLSPHGLPHTTNARSRHSAPPTECRDRENQSWQAKPRDRQHRSAAVRLAETPADAVDGGAMTMRGRSGGQPARIRACLCWCRHPRSSPLPDRASGPTRPPAARCLSTFGSSMCRGRKPGEFRPYRSECGGPVLIIYQPSVTRHALVQARKGARSIGPISTRIAVQAPSCRWCPRRGMAATHGQSWCQ